MFSDIPVEVGVIYEGERIRKENLQVQFGGLKIPKKFELARVRPSEEIEDGLVKIIGPDIKDLEEGKSYPLGILVEIAGKELDEDLEGIIERKIHPFTNYIEGMMHLNQRYDIFIRLSKSSFKKGLNSFEQIGKIYQRLYKAELPIIEKVQISFITDKEKIEELYPKALEIYERRDARARALRDEDVELFYGCTLCQSFAPTHICIITPQRYANCGAISWFDGRAAARVDPKGPIFEVKKGKLLDLVKGEYSGVNEMTKKKTFGEIERIWLYSAFGYPHTSCGCFEAVAFYIPEVEGFGLAHRGFREEAVNGLPFLTIADSTAGGRQVDGFHGSSVEYMRSAKFLQADGGWGRIVWLPSELKERIKDAIPNDLLSKIATEREVANVQELERFLKKVGHPVVARWKPKISEVPEKLERVVERPVVPEVRAGIMIKAKGVKLRARKVVIKRRASREL